MNKKQELYYILESSMADGVECGGISKTYYELLVNNLSAIRHYKEPKYEKILEWEKRINAKFPEESLVYAWFQGDCHHGDRWDFMEYQEAVSLVEFPKDHIIVANHFGKPSEDIIK